MGIASLPLRPESVLSIRFSLFKTRQVHTGRGVMEIDGVRRGRRGSTVVDDGRPPCPPDLQHSAHQISARGSRLAIQIGCYRTVVEKVFARSGVPVSVCANKYGMRTAAGRLGLGWNDLTDVLCKCPSNPGNSTYVPSR